MSHYNPFHASQQDPSSGSASYLPSPSLNDSLFQDAMEHDSHQHDCDEHDCNEHVYHGFSTFHHHLDASQDILDDDQDDEYEDDESCSEDESDSDISDTPRQPASGQDQTELRKKILQIQSDTTIPATEKAKKIQELMTSQWSQKQKTQVTRAQLASNKLEHKRSDFSIVTELDKQKTYYDKEAGILGCKHYQRATKLQAHCCGKWYSCRFCHDEISDHNIIRNLTTTMMCMYCATVQPAGQDCINEQCKKRVARYYCKECKLWDDDPRKTIYHCHDCGICRIGKGLGQDYFHCKKCNVCMAMSLQGRHKCIERNLECDCPICGEYMFTSTTTVIFMPCGHCIHYKCHQEYIQTSYQCPTCFKSLANMTEYFLRIDQMLAQHQMPPEYENTRSYIYCNDCEKKCYSKFHFLYHKCIYCNGYNTKVLHTVEMNPKEAAVNAQHASDAVVASAAMGAAPGGGVSPIQTHTDAASSPSSASSGSASSISSATSMMAHTTHAVYFGEHQHQD